MKPSIGEARLRGDGALELRLRAQTGAVLGDALLVVMPSDPRFKSMLEHIGPLMPGELRPVPPWPDEAG